jgi:tryptophan-rich sensory protein
MKNTSQALPLLAPKSLLGMGIAVLIAESAGIIGSVFTAKEITTWYTTLNMPMLAPPNWVFGPVWTTLFFLMGIASYLVWRQGWECKQVKLVLGIFALQLVLNIAWSLIFFGLHSPGWALVEIVLLWLAILATIISFAKLSKPAAWLLLPYLLWVSFATYLNYAIWTLN